MVVCLPLERYSLVPTVATDCSGGPADGMREPPLGPCSQPRPPVACKAAIGEPSSAGMSADVRGYEAGVRSKAQRHALAVTAVAVIGGGAAAGCKAQSERQCAHAACRSTSVRRSRRADALRTESTARRTRTPRASHARPAAERTAPADPVLMAPRRQGREGPRTPGAAAAGRWLFDRTDRRLRPGHRRRRSRVSRASAGMPGTGRRSHRDVGSAAAR